MQTYYLGIDLHKRSSTWVLLDGERKVRSKQTVPCTPERVGAALRSLPVEAASISVAVEPVCGWRWFIRELEERGTTVHLANPVRTRLIAESKQKTDTLDATALAELLMAGYLPESYRAPEAVVSLRNLMRTRSYFIQQRTSAINRIHGLVTSTGMHLMKEQPSKKKGRDELRASSDPNMRDMIHHYDEVDAHLRGLDAQIRAIATTSPVPKLLMTMPGVGFVTSLTLYAEVGEFARFRSPEKLVSYAGLNPSQRSSGGHVRHGHISKQGSTHIRSSIVEAAFRIRPGTDERLYRFYERIQRTAGAKKARVALARYMLVILWHMVKKNKPYNPLPSEGTPKRDDLVTSLAPVQLAAA